MGEAQRLGPVPADGRALDEENGVPPGTADRRRKDRTSVRRHREQPVSAQERPTGARRTGEPLSQRDPDAVELGGPPCHCHDRETELPVEHVEVKHVEPTPARAVEEERADAVERTEASHEGDETASTVRAVDPDLRGPDRFDLLR